MKFIKSQLLTDSLVQTISKRWFEPNIELVHFQFKS